MKDNKLASRITTMLADLRKQGNRYGAYCDLRDTAVLKLRADAEVKALGPFRKVARVLEPIVDAKLARAARYEGYGEWFEHFVGATNSDGTAAFDPNEVIPADMLDVSEKLLVYATRSFCILKNLYSLGEWAAELKIGNKELVREIESGIWELGYDAFCDHVRGY